MRGKEIEAGILHRCFGRLEFAHVRVKKLGGDRYNGITLCTEAHTQAPWSWHRDGAKSFQRRFGFDATQRAREIGEELLGVAAPAEN